MNNFSKKYSVVIAAFLFLSLLEGPFSYGQSKKELTTMIRVASVEIYENPDKVIRVGNQVLAKAGDDVDLKIGAYRLISDAYSSKRDYEKSLEYVIKANELLKYSNDDLLKISIINKTAIQYHQLKIYDKSIQYLDQAEQLIINYPVKDSIYTQLGKNYAVRGFIFKEKLNCEIAIFFFDKGIAELMKAHRKTNNTALSIVKYNKGNCNILMLNNDLAKIHFKQAYDHAKILNAKSLEAFALKGLAKVATLEGNYVEAIKTLNEALLISADVNDLILNQEIFNGLSENYLAVNEWDKYKMYHSKFIKTQNLIKQSERKSISVSLKDKEKELDSSLITQKTKFYFAIGFVVLLIILFLFVFLFLMKNKKKEIEQLNFQIQQLQSEKAN
jgi:tetratricopeptide (TPR) repeat protein